MGFDGDNEILYISLSEQSSRGGHRKTSIGCFTSLEEGDHATVADILPYPNLLPEDTVGELLSFLEKESKKTSDKTSNEEVVESLQYQLNESKARIELLTKELASKEADLAKLQHGKSDKPQDDLGADHHNTSTHCNSKKRQPSPSRGEGMNVKKQQKMTIELRYLWKGQVGTIDVGSHQKTIKVDELKAYVIKDHLTMADLEKDDAAKRNEMKYVPMRIDGVQLE